VVQLSSLIGRFVGKLKEKVDKTNVVQFIQESIDNIRQSLDTGDYKFSIERIGDLTEVKTSRDLSIGDFTEVMVNILMLTPPEIREDLIALSIYMTALLQEDLDSRVLN
jgi:poly-gamma-glutamate capsule biosynthesis protein CapA/YwtB (metallophosphatase superfamily)